MKVSHFLTSFFSIQSSGIEALDLAGDAGSRSAEASKRVIGPMPLSPARSAFQVASGADAERRNETHAGDDDASPFTQG